MDIKTWFSNAWTKVKANVPAVVRNYPYASAALFFGGMMLMQLLAFIF